MPLLLSERLKRVDSIHGFLTAAEMRFDEGRQLARVGHRTAAIYLWGYVAESVLKASWFRLKGFATGQAITLADVANAKKEAISLLSVPWPTGGLHNLQGWSLALVNLRAVLGPAYTTPFIAPLVTWHATQIYNRWSEALRYKPNRAYYHEVRAVEDSASWFLDHEAML